MKRFLSVLILVLCVALCSGDGESQTLPDIKDGAQDLAMASEIGQFVQNKIDEMKSHLVKRDASLEGDLANETSMFEEDSNDAEEEGDEDDDDEEDDEDYEDDEDEDYEDDDDE